jgi:hypothetical protein
MRPNGNTTSPTLTRMSTSRKVIIDRLRRENMRDVADAIEAGEVSAFNVAVEMGWAKRHNILGTGSENMSKRNAWALHKVFKRCKVNV